MDKRLEEAIKKFLSERRESKFGEYAEVTQKDMENLFYVIELLISQKWDSDADGDYPVEVKVVDRHKFARSSYVLVPYLHKCKTSADIQDYINRVMINVSIAGEELRSGSAWISRAFEDKQNG